MLNTYLDGPDGSYQDAYTTSQYVSQEKHGYILGTAMSAYMWFMLDMGDKFLDTGAWSLPGFGKTKFKKDLWNSGDVVLRRNSYRLSGPHNASMAEKMGLKFRGATATGMLNMGAARALSAVNIGYTLTSPGWYAARVAGLAVGAAEAGGMAAAVGTLGIGLGVGLVWFGGKAILNNAAKGMQKTQYVDMGNSFVDNGAIYTSRQRAVRAIAESHLQARSAIGNEAQLFHHSGG